MLKERVLAVVLWSIEWRGGYWRPLFLGATLLIGLVMLVLGLSPTTGRTTMVNDKVQHFLAFALLVFAFYSTREGDVEETRQRGGHAQQGLVGQWTRRHAWGSITAVVFFLASLLSEVVQRVVTTRTFQWGDILANLLGASAGLALAILARRRWQRRQEFKRLYQIRGDAAVGGGGGESDEGDLGNVWYGGDEDETRILFDDEE